LIFDLDLAGVKSYPQAMTDEPGGYRVALAHHPDEAKARDRRRDLLIGRQPPHGQRAHHRKLLGHLLRTGGVALREEPIEKRPVRLEGLEVAATPQPQALLHRALEAPVRALHIAVLVATPGGVPRAPKPIMVE